jgi:hypothetical protein
MNLKGRNFLLDVSAVASVYSDRRIDTCLAAPCAMKSLPIRRASCWIFSNVYADSLPA